MNTVHDGANVIMSKEEWAQHAQEISESVESLESQLADAWSLLDEAENIVQSLASGRLTALGERDVKIWGRGLVQRIRAAKEKRG